MLTPRTCCGWGSCVQVWQLPDELIPLALSFYQLQRGPLISSAAAAAADDEWHSSSGSGTTSTSSGTDGAAAVSELMAGSWRVLVQQFMQCSPSTALRMVAPWLYVYDAASSQFDVLPPLNLALEPDALAVLDCGSEVIIYVGKVLMALVEGLPTPSGAEGPTSNGGSSGQQGSSSAVPLPPQPQQQQQPAAAPANGTPAAGANGQPPALAPVPDMAEAAAPAVRCAQALTRGRVPVPAIHVVEDTAGMVALVRRLVPLHEDPVALQLLLLPHLNDISPMEHGYLLDWHRHWAGVAAAAAAQRCGGQQAAVRSGGARLASAEAGKGAQELSFGSWYSSFGVVLKSPKGAIAREGDANVEVE